MKKYVIKIRLNNDTCYLFEMLPKKVWSCVAIASATCDEATRFRRHKAKKIAKKWSGGTIEKVC